MATAQALKSTDARTSNETSTEDLVLQIDALKSDIASLTSRIANLGTTGAKVSKSEARSVTAKAAANGEALLKDLSAREQELEDQARETISEHPIKSIAIAAGIGFAAALLARR